MRPAAPEAKGYVTTVVGGLLGSLAVGIPAGGVALGLIALRVGAPDKAQIRDAGKFGGFLEIGWAIAMFFFIVALGVWAGAGLGSRFALKKKGYPAAPLTGWLYIGALPAVWILLGWVVRFHLSGPIAWIYTLAIFAAAGTAARAIARASSGRTETPMRDDPNAPQASLALGTSDQIDHV